MLPADGDGAVLPNVDEPLLDVRAVVSLQQAKLPTQHGNNLGSPQSSVNFSLLEIHSSRQAWQGIQGWIRGGGAQQSKRYENKQNTDAWDGSGTDNRRT